MTRERMICSGSLPSCWPSRGILHQMVTSLRALLPHDVTIDVVDIGANPIDHAPPYKPLLDQGRATVIGFEPNPEALARLNAATSPHERYFPHAIANGAERDFHICHAPGMSSLLKPNEKMLSYFNGLPDWGAVQRIERIQTRRLDDIPEITSPDLLKIDVQGAELEIFSHAPRVLGELVAIHTEVAFVPIYHDQPHFSDVDLALRKKGFLLHRFANLTSRVFSPIVVNNDLYAGLSQAFEADVVYIRDFTRFRELPAQKLLKLAVILHEIYGSYDVAYEALACYDDAAGTRISKDFLRGLTGVEVP